MTTRTGASLFFAVVSVLLAMAGSPAMGAVFGATAVLIGAGLL